MAVARAEHPGFTTMIAQGFGAGVGRVGPYYEQGNWYRGGAVQMLFIAWLYGQQNQVRPMSPPDTTQEDLIRASKSFDLSQQSPPVDWSKALAASADEGHHQGGRWPARNFCRRHARPDRRCDDQTHAERSGVVQGRTVSRQHEDQYSGLLVHVVVRRFGRAESRDVQSHSQDRRPEIADKQYAVIAPVLHCSYTRATENTVVGERSMGDARLDYSELTYGWFDYFLKGHSEGNDITKWPKVRYFTMGRNKWQASDQWPPRGAEPMKFYLSSGGKANTLNGDGKLWRGTTRERYAGQFYIRSDESGSVVRRQCLLHRQRRAGRFVRPDARWKSETTSWFTRPTFKEGIELSGPIDVTLYVSSDAKDTDFTVKLIDVDENGKAWNLDETIQRMRYRDGYDKPLVWMESGKVYKVKFQPMTTSNYFAPGHRLRIEISSQQLPALRSQYEHRRPKLRRDKRRHREQYGSSLETVSGGGDDLGREEEIARRFFPAKYAKKKSCPRNTRKDAKKEEEAFARK